MAKTVHIDYDKKIAKYFENNYQSLIPSVGAEKARKIKKIIDRLKAANNFAIFLSLRLGNPHALEGNLSDCFSISIIGNYRLIVQPAVDNLMPDSLRQCDSLSVKGVVDYHGGKESWIIP